MTRILTIIALLFATPAWAGKIEDAGDFSLICSAEDEGHKGIEIQNVPIHLDFLLQNENTFKNYTRLGKRPEHPDLLKEWEKRAPKGSHFVVPRAPASLVSGKVGYGENCTVKDWSDAIISVECNDNPIIINRENGSAVFNRVALLRRFSFWKAFWLGQGDSDSWKLTTFVTFACEMKGGIVPAGPTNKF